MTPPLAVKLDEDLSPTSAEPLVAGATPCARYWPRDGVARRTTSSGRGCAERVMFITADRGFGDIRAYPPGEHPGIVVLRADRESVGEYGKLMAALVAGYSLESLRGCVTVVTPRGIRVRRPQSR